MYLFRTRFAHVVRARCTYRWASLSLFVGQNAPIVWSTPVTVSLIKLCVLAPVRIFFRISLKISIPVISGKKAAVPPGWPRTMGRFHEAAYRAFAMGLDTSPSCLDPTLVLNYHTRHIALQNRLALRPTCRLALHAQKTMRRQLQFRLLERDPQPIAGGRNQKSESTKPSILTPYAGIPTSAARLSPRAAGAT